jgi:Ca2+-dependent lipid-binding protein
MAELHLRVVEAVDLPRMDANATDGDCIISINGDNAKQTRVIRNSMHPRWNEAFHGVLLNHRSTTAEMLMKDEDII